MTARGGVRNRSMRSGRESCGVSRMLNIDWRRFRRQMPITRRWVYLDHSAVAPLPATTAAGDCSVE